MSDIIIFLKKLRLVVANLCILRLFVCCQSLYSIVYHLVIFLKLKSYLIYKKNTTQHCLSCIKVAHTITNIIELPTFAHNPWMSCLRQHTTCQ